MARHVILMARAAIIRLVHCPNISTSDIDVVVDLALELNVDVDVDLSWARMSWIPLLCFFPVIVKQAALNHDLYLPHINWRCLSSLCSEHRQIDSRKVKDLR
ncbi:hypothetical protein GW17_00023943 [Ensete ventricosum]|nr:hypothetical protein GW17_00023943 [Ensete ventricosum]